MILRFIKNPEDTYQNSWGYHHIAGKSAISATASVPLQLYFGPNDYNILRKHKNEIPEMDKIVNLGRDMYAFVRPINKFIVMPVFGFFKSFVGSLGIAILLLTLFIRLLTSPLVYTSYLSGAKMKALRPEIDKLKEKYNNDQQQVGVEQMKLFREARCESIRWLYTCLVADPSSLRCIVSLTRISICVGLTSCGPITWLHTMRCFIGVSICQG